MADYDSRPGETDAEFYARRAMAREADIIAWQKRVRDWHLLRAAKRAAGLPPPPPLN